MNKVFVLGSINMDLVFNLSRMPKKGETIKAKDFLLTPGGKGANQAVACSKQGVKTYILGSLGFDELSKKAEDSLFNMGVGTQYLQYSKEYSVGLASILLTDNDNRIITHSGANNFQDEMKINSVIESLGETNDYLLAQLEIPVTVVKDAFKTAKGKSMITVLNAAPAQKLSSELLKLTDILVVNESEIEELTDINIISEKEISEAILKLKKSGVKSILLTLGKAGSKYYKDDLVFSQKAYPVEVVDTTAAGDSFIGGFVSQLLSGKDITFALKYATACASLTIMKKGAQIAIPNKNQVEEFLRKEGEIL